MHNEASTHQRKKAALLKCQKALIPANAIDNNIDDCKTALQDALKAIREYPQGYKTARRVLRKDTPDYNAKAVENILCLCLFNDAPQNAMSTINEALKNALENLSLYDNSII